MLIITFLLNLVSNLRNCRRTCGLPQRSPSETWRLLDCGELGRSLGDLCYRVGEWCGFGRHGDSRVAGVGVGRVEDVEAGVVGRGGLKPLDTEYTP